MYLQHLFIPCIPTQLPTQQPEAYSDDLDTNF